jgi:hypothetical protein
MSLRLFFARMSMLHRSIVEHDRVRLTATAISLLAIQ